MDALPYKVELKNESWRNVEKLLRSGAKFCMMSDHPVILQRNMFYTLRHLLHFGLSKSNAISKITSEAAEIIGIQGIGQIKPALKHHLLFGMEPFFINQLSNISSSRSKNSSQGVGLRIITNPQIP
jgi:hypothetical protein